MAASTWILCLCLTAACTAEDSLLSNVGKGITKEVVAVATPIETGVVAVGSSQCSNVKHILGVAYEQVEGEKEPDLNQLTLEYRDESIKVVYNITSAAQKITHSELFNPRKKLIIFIHGFTDDPSKASFSNISDALLKEGECNVLALDASSLIRWLYLRSTTYVRFIGEKLGEVLAALVHGGANPDGIHIIGHSLGAHISGFTGKQFTNLTGLKLGRISGLDPAGPCFSHVDDALRLQATDASFVDVIHTDGGVYGLKESIGQVDYYPNDGVQQPNCLFQTCSHSRAWLYYSESVVNGKAFPAVRCADWSAFKKGHCDGKISYMGYPSEPGTTGTFYLQTEDETPFARGLNGTKYVNNEAFVKNLSDNIGEQAKDVGEQAKNVGEQAKKATDKVGEQAKNVGGGIADQTKNASEGVKKVGDGIGQHAKSVGDSIKNFFG